MTKAKSKHGDRFDYSKVEYVNVTTKVIIICKLHGEFEQTPHRHLRQKYCCKKCAGNYKYTTEEWIEVARKVHGDKYDYSKTKYINTRTEVCIICPKHGKFYQLPYSHIAGCACGKCGHESAAKS